jgi:hypothetical protein
MVPSSSGLSLRAARLSAAAATASALQPAPLFLLLRAACSSKHRRPTAAQRTPRLRGARDTHRTARAPPCCRCRARSSLAPARRMLRGPPPPPRETQAHTSGATHRQRPRISHNGAYSAAATLRVQQQRQSGSVARTQVREPSTEAVLGARRQKQIPQACAEPRLARGGAVRERKHAIAHRRPWPSASAVRAWAN